MDISLSYGRRAKGDAASVALASIFARNPAHNTAMPINPRTISIAMTESAIFSRRVTGKGIGGGGAPRIDFVVFDATTMRPQIVGG